MRNKEIKDAKNINKKVLQMGHILIFQSNEMWYKYKWRKGAILIDSKIN